MESPIKKPEFADTHPGSREETLKRHSDTLPSPPPEDMEGAEGTLDDHEETLQRKEEDIKTRPMNEIDDEAKTPLMPVNPDLTLPPDQEFQERLRQEGELAFQSLRALPSGQSKLDASVEACLRSPHIRRRIGEIGLEPAETASIALRIAEIDPAVFIEMISAEAISLPKPASLALAREVASGRAELFSKVATALKLEESDVKAVINQSNPDSRRRLIRSFNESVGEFVPVAEMQGRETAELTQEDLEMMAGVEAAEWSMALALAKERPNQAAAERERNRITEELNEKIRETAELGQGMNLPLLATLENRAAPAVFKPRRRESGLNPDTPELRTGIKPGTYYAREWLAFQINRALGLNVVPTTVIRSGPDGIGSMQDWKPGEAANQTHFVALARQNEKIREGLEDIAFFDCAVINTDRHDGNWMIMPDDSQEGIDHGLILPTEDHPDFEGSLRSWPLWAVGGQPLPERHLNRIRQYRNATQIQTALRQCFQAALGPDAEKVWDKFNQSLTRVETDGLPELSDWDRNTRDAITRYQYLDSNKNDDV